MQTALEDSRQMLRDMEADGLLAKGTADTKPEQLGSFEGLAAEVKKTVLGQDAFVDSVVRAMRRPFVLGTEGAAARNVILLWGAPGTGRHFALAETARIMAARGLLQSDRMAVMDLALYSDPGGGKAVFAGPIRRPARPGRDRGVRALRELPPRLFAHPLRPCGQGQCAPVQPVSGQQRGHSGGSRYSACPPAQ